jgi:poly(3-hydroxybutyrate) depolymerase
MPDELRGMKFPKWSVPDSLRQWQETDRVQTKKTLMQCLGDLPPRPAPPQVKTLSREDRGDYVMERFEFHNGVDSLVPGILLLPKNRDGRAPAVIGLHGHGGSSETICTDVNNPQCVDPDLARRGFVVAAIDTYFCGARARKPRKDWPQRYRHADEGTLFRLYL